MPDHQTENVLPSLTDDQITTERKVARRSFLTSSGAMLAGAAGVVAGLRAASARTVSQDPKPRPDDAPREDPDKPRRDDKERGRDDPDKPRPDDKERRRDDPDKPRPDDKERRRDDPDKRPPDADKRPDAAKR